MSHVTIFQLGMGVYSLNASQTEDNFASRARIARAETLPAVLRGGHRTARTIASVFRPFAEARLHGWSGIHGSSVATLRLCRDSGCSAP